MVCRVVAGLRRSVLFAGQRPPYEVGQHVTYLLQDIRGPDHAFEVDLSLANVCDAQQGAHRAYGFRQIGGRQDSSRGRVAHSGTI